MEMIKKFIEDNIDTIRNGINFLERKSKLGFQICLNEIGYEIEIVSGKLNPYKEAPTETDCDNKKIRIVDSYLKRNPNFLNFDDEVGWSYHEFCHAIIFAGKMNEFLKINSPFTYPMNTDEIYTFGFQIKHINDFQFNNLVKFYKLVNCDEYETIFNIYRSIIRNNM